MKKLIALSVILATSLITAYGGYTQCDRESEALFHKLLQDVAQS